MTSIPVTVRTQEGPWHELFEISSTRKMGFLSEAPARILQINNVATRISTGGDSAYTNDGFDQLVLTGFSTGGDRYLYESGDARYYTSDGGVATHLDQVLTLASSWTASDAGVIATARQVIDFTPTGGAWGPWVVLGCNHTLRAYDCNGLTWGDAHPSTGAFYGSVLQIFATNAYVFVAVSVGSFYRWTGQTLTTTWAQPFTAGALCFAMYKNVLYRATGATIVPATNNDGSGWGAAVTVGTSTSNITHLTVSDNGYLVISKAEGVWTYDGTTLSQLMDLADVSSSTNYVGCKAWHGALYGPESTRLQKLVLLSGSSRTQSDIHPDMRGDAAKEQYGHGTPVQCFSAPGALYVALDDGEGAYPELLRYNEIGYHQVYKGGTTPTGLTRPDQTGSGTASASTETAGREAAKAVDNLNATINDSWETASGFTTGWWKYDFGVGVTKTITRATIAPAVTTPSAAPKNFTIDGSNNDADWTTLSTQTNVTDWGAAGEIKTFDFANPTAYRYYRINVTANNGGATFLMIGEVELMEAAVTLPVAMNAAGYSRQMGWLVINDGTTRVKPILNTGPGEYPSYATSGYVVTPYFDGGFPDVYKTWAGIVVETENCTSLNTVTVSYQVDTESSWTSAGSLTANGKQELILGGINASVKGKKIRFKIALARDPADVTATPRVVYPIIIRVLVHNPGQDGYALTLELSPEASLCNGYGRVRDAYTTDEATEFLNNLRNTADTVIWTNEWGVRRRVVVTDMGETDTRPGTDATDTRSAPTKSLRLMSVFLGATRQLNGYLEFTSTASATLFTWEGNSAYGVRRYGGFAYGA